MAEKPDSIYDVTPKFLGELESWLKQHGFKTTFPPATPATVLYSWAQFRHSAANGTDGGALTASTWVTRPCAEVTDADGILSVASNQLTLTAGTYRIRVTASGYHGGGRISTRLRNTTDSSTVLVGTTSYAVDSEWTSEIAGQFTVAASKALEIQHWATVTQATSGLGIAVTSGEVEVYMVGELWKTV